MARGTSKRWYKVKDAGKNKKKWEAREVKSPEGVPIFLFLPLLYLGIGRRKKKVSQVCKGDSEGRKKRLLSSDSFSKILKRNHFFGLHNQLVVWPHPWLQIRGLGRERF